jgi:hypothetical protein
MNEGCLDDDDDIYVTIDDCSSDVETSSVLAIEEKAEVATPAVLSAVQTLLGNDLHQSELVPSASSVSAPVILISNVCLCKNEEYKIILLD